MSDRDSHFQGPAHLRILIAATRLWNQSLYEEWSLRSSHDTAFAGDRGALDDRIAAFKPELICFLHWSWMVPSEIYDRYECIAFHMTDLPFGRGGSPLQNLILRGYRETVVTAFRVSAALDAGPVYLKRPLSLDGRAEDIYRRASRVALGMIDDIVLSRPTPVPQSGDVVEFKRRTPGESAIGNSSSVGDLFDFIRMLDADAYPRAFLEHDGFRYEFSDAALENGELVGRVRITPVKDKKP